MNYLSHLFINVPTLLNFVSIVSGEFNFEPHRTSIKWKIFNGKIVRIYEENVKCGSSLNIVLYLDPCDIYYFL